MKTIQTIALSGMLGLALACSTSTQTVSSSAPPPPPIAATAPVVATVEAPAEKPDNGVHEDTQKEYEAAQVKTGDYESLTLGGKICIIKNATCTPAQANKNYKELLTIEFDISEGEEKTGIESQVKVVKNKIGPPFRTAIFNIMFGTGIDAMVDLLNVAVDKEIITKSGAWFAYKEQQIGQGSLKASQWLKDNDHIAQEIRTRILETG
jgi:hypothetical protein